MENSTPSEVSNIELSPLAEKDIKDTKYLALINKQHSFTNTDKSKFIRVMDFAPTSPAGVFSMRLHSSAMAAFVEMRDTASSEKEINFLGVSDGYRSADEQRELYYSDAGNSYVLPPNHSEHITGLAIDMTIQGVSGGEFGNSTAGRWVAENSHRFGLILRYPKGAETKTGINYEPWHFRYIGKGHASYMKQKISFSKNIFNTSKKRANYILKLTAQNTMYCIKRRKTEP